VLDPNDNGWRSRKLWFSVFTSLLIFYGAVYGATHHGYEVMYPEMTMGLIGVASLFFGANSFGKWTVAKNAKGLADAKKVADASDEDSADRQQDRDDATQGGDAPKPGKDEAP